MRADVINVSLTGFGTLLGGPFRLEDGPAAPVRAAPTEPGQDTAEVFAEWLA